MKFKIDENLLVDAVKTFQEAGYNTVSVLDQSLQGCSDKTLISICKNENRILVTLDIDFANLLTYPPQEYAGIIVLRLKKYDKKHILTVLEKLISFMSKKLPESELWIVEENKIRIRK